jgi:large subunit ribosomal protein L28
MSKRCELTGRGPTTGNRIGHSNVKNRRRWLPNLVRKRYEIQELGQILTLRLSTSAIRTIDKHGGISNAICRAKEAALSDRLRRIRGRLLKKRATPHPGR